MPPLSTYRLQLRAEFGFIAAAAVVPYLAELGVSHVYCSPVLQAVPGSVHGYDVVDHTRLSEELGGDAGWAELAAACRRHGLGLVVDVVPNHVAMPTPESLNPVLWAALAAGPGSEAARWFDVDWEAEGGRIMLPVLGAPLDEAVAAGDVHVDTGAAVVRYFDHAFPLADGSLDGIDAGDVTAVLDRQHYRLAFWREARTALNYRRFFDVTTLMGVRVELPEVFDGSHERLLALVASGDVDGLRIDHPDGLADPGGYLDRLAAASGGVWTVVEKILEPGEELPAGWRCAGTTGYDALGALGNLFADPDGRSPLDALWRRVAAEDTTTDLGGWETVVEHAKRLVLDTTFPAEVRRLVGEAEAALAGASGSPSVPGEGELTAALGELLVAFDVYRAYPSSLDRLHAAVERAAQARPDLREALETVRALASGTTGDQAAAGFATRLAQTTGPVMAKGVEDTALYRYHRLLAVNEVGGEPGIIGRRVEDFHRFCTHLAEHWPTSMTTLSTHDTKRSEDVRSRLLVLAELPDEWSRAVSEWDRLVAGGDWPTLDAPTRYFAWQTLAGAWPLPAERLAAYLGKATREAKLHTSWTDADEAYDEAVATFARRVTADRAVVDAVGSFVREHLLVSGRTVSLGQKLVQLTMPGVPDVYQGNELTDLSLVDPDNRRPVDYDVRRRVLAELDAGRLPSLEADVEGRAKLAVTATALRVRREHPGCLLDGGYSPLSAQGPAAEHLLGFQRGTDVVTLVTRLPVGLARRGGWGDTTVALPDGEWRNELTGRTVTGGRVADLLSPLPVALLTRTGG